MQSSLSVDERLEAQFSSWDIAPVPEIPDLLMTLRAHGTTIDDRTRTFQRGEIGQVTLTKPDGQKWLGSAELRRSDRITADKRDPEDIIGPINGFSLLGFAFLFKGTEQVSLEKFLEGTLETM